MPQQVRVLAAMPDNLSSIPGPHLIRKRERERERLSSDCYN